MEDRRLENPGRARSVLCSFVVMAVCFSLNHGTVSACIPLSSAEFGPDLGLYSLGTLYLLYTLTAMFFSTSIVAALGQKWSLVLGTAIYCLYVASYIAAELAPASKWYTAEIGATFGGVAAGFLWTAQGGYFSTCAGQYADAKGITKAAASGTLSGIFATVYLGFELVMKILSSLIIVLACGDSWQGDILTGKCMEPTKLASAKLWVFGVFAVVAVTSCFMMTFINPMTSTPEAGLVGYAQLEEGEEQKFRVVTPCLSTDKMLSAVRLLTSSKKMMLLMWFNIQFAVAAAFMNSYVTGSVITDGLGEDKIGYFVAIIPIVATAASMPIAWLNNKIDSKVPVIVFGQLCWLGFAAVFLLVPTDETAVRLGTWTTLVPLICLFGLARATWEGPWKGVMVDMFPGESEAAFANLILQNGGASTIWFFVFPSLTPKAKEWIFLVTSVISVTGFVGAVGLDRKQKRDAEAARLDR